MKVNPRPLLAALAVCAGIVHAGAGSSYPRLHKGASRKNLVKTAAQQSPAPRPDTIHIVMTRVEFNGGRSDSTELTTGTGLMGDYLGTEENRYYNSDTVYVYDGLNHDSVYFANQLEYVRYYFDKVSRGRLHFTFSIYPPENKDIISVPETMKYYSPGGKKKKESYDEYGFRKTVGLMRFVKDAVIAVNNEKTTFSNLQKDPVSGAIVNSRGHKVIFLIVHAGASFLTDGGEQGFFGQDSPSDMIDAFISQEFFEYFQDTLELDTSGIFVESTEDSLLIDEIMLVSETSNQDSLNWGIHGILVNQVARAIGIPDLFSTTSGITAVGAFCIMDFAGYSAAKGFIPPWPSAWVRTYMGWDTPVVATVGQKATFRIKALSAADPSTDTTILMVPLNNHEYYLIENRQRNLSTDPEVFEYDTTEEDIAHIAGYPFNVNLDKAVVRTSGESRNNIMEVRNFDAGLPASGIVVWHIDEYVIRDRIKYNMLNADSIYRGVRLVEADGITDLGVEFRDIFYQAAFDYGGAEDVFPHKAIRKIDNRTETDSIGSITPWSRPSTHSNDGGHTWVSLGVKPVNLQGQELYILNGEDKIYNYVDSVFEITVNWETPRPAIQQADQWVRPAHVKGWPKRMMPDSGYLEPVICNLDKRTLAPELIVMSESGKMYVWPADTLPSRSLGSSLDTLPIVSMLFENPSAIETTFVESTYFDSARNADTTVINDTLIEQQIAHEFALDSVAWLNAPPQKVRSIPTVINNRIYVSSAESSEIFVLDSIQTTPVDTAAWRSIALPARPTTYVSKPAGSFWVAGCAGGVLAFGDTAAGSLVDTFILPTPARITSLAALSTQSGTVVCVQADSTVTICNLSAGSKLSSPTKLNGLPPYQLATGDLNRDGSVEIVITDRVQGVWCLTQDLQPAQGWEKAPIDWATVYYQYEEDGSPTARSRLPHNEGYPALADVNRDGLLDIVVGGSNGMYAFNYKGVLLYGWPGYLDNRFAYYRGTITTSPIVAGGRNADPLVVFAAPTGERETFSFYKIDSTDTDSTKVYFTREYGVRDSIGGLKQSLIDTLLVFGDSLIPDYVLPGGFIDAMHQTDKDRPPQRPYFVNSLPRLGPVRQSNWPITFGGRPATSPLIDDLDDNGVPDLIAVSQSGWVYRWELENALSIDSVYWPQIGFDNGRSFTFAGYLPPAITKDNQPIQLFSYPNPAEGIDNVEFRFKFNGPTTDVRLDIFSYSGYHIYHWEPDRKDTFTTNWQEWNELPQPVSIKRFGPGVYRCRLGATVNGSRQSAFWKLAVVK
ncbi:MAG: hypothetical protein GF398_05490 [Chitinivibrionales bacterium]|nr:hypothetical protein [Chitinivibrionales bacterium]